MCRGGRGLLDGETGVQDGRFDRCNVARRPFVPLQTVWRVFIQGLKEQERSRKRGFFFVCVPIVLEVYTGMEQGTKGTSYNKGETGVKAYAFQC